MAGKYGSELPPGFRFHPTDEELIMCYLRNQAASRPCPVSIIPEVDIYKFDPWELPEKAGFGENEWYFFSPRDRKYPNGIRPNRAAVSGYWKATGTDKRIHSGSKNVGVKKALVFYKGRPPKGTKTFWIMHEYRLNTESTSVPKKQNGSTRLDDWVLCRIYKKKKNVAREVEIKVQDSGAHLLSVAEENTSEELQAIKFPRPCSLSHLLELDCLGSSSQILSDNSHSSSFYSQNPTSNSRNLLPHGHGVDRIQAGEVPYNEFTDSMKFQVNHQGGVLLNQPILVNPIMFEFQSQTWS